MSTMLDALPPLPQVAGLPLLGNMVEFRYRRLALLLRVSQLGDLASFQNGPRTIILVNAPEYVQTILVDQATKVDRSTRIRDLARPLIGDGLLNSDKAVHRRQRQLVAPAFTPRRIKAYAETMTTYAELQQSSWQPGTTIDLAHEMMRLTLWIVGKTLLNCDVRSDTDVLNQSITIATRYIVKQLTSVWTIPRSWSTPANYQFRAALAELDTTIARIVKERRRTGEDTGDLLSMLIQARDETGNTGLTDAEIRDEALTIILAGRETVANALAWTWLLLLQHPTSYRQMQAEVDQVLGGRTATLNDLPNLPYTLQVFKEALRLYPPTYYISRHVVTPLELGPYHFSPGTRLAISPYTLHRRSSAFAQPEQFVPDRWTTTHEAQLPRYAYLPFGAGPHICIGNHFAMMEAHLILATLAQRVTFERISGQDVPMDPLVNLRPKGPINVVVKRRSGPERAG